MVQCTPYKKYELYAIDITYQRRPVVSPWHGIWLKPRKVYLQDVLGHVLLKIKFNSLLLKFIVYTATKGSGISEKGLS